MGETGDTALLGRTIAGKFLVEAYLGGGAMGAVYRARQRGLDRFVAVKVLHETVAHDPMFVTRFHREAKAASRLDHPNSMRVVDFGEEPDGLLYIAMEYLEGRDLFQVMHDDWPISPERTVAVLGQVLAALAVAHDMGVVHRDLKPENIMILRGTDDEGQPTDVVKVCDFGIAKITDPDEDAEGAARTDAATKLTTKGFLVGTPEYMSPEQARGEKLDARSDLYAIGVILYQLLTGRMPFTGDSPVAIILKQLSTPPEPPHVVFPAVNPELEAVCLKALAKDREERFGSAREMRSALRAAIGKGAPGQELASLPPPPEESAEALELAPTRRILSDAPPVIAEPAPVATVPPAAARTRSGRPAWLVALLVVVAVVLAGASVHFARRLRRAPVERDVVDRSAPATSAESPAPAASPEASASAETPAPSESASAAPSAPPVAHPHRRPERRPRSGPAR